METIPHFIDGAAAEPASGAWLESVEPAVGRPWARVADGDADDVDRAVAAARRAFDGWARTPAIERARILFAAADGIQRDFERFARAESIDTGKPIALARSVDIPRAIANLRYFGGAVLHGASEAYDGDGRSLSYVLRRPRGVAGCIAPWNLPLYLFTWKIAPALATGNTVVAKPSELTPMTAFMLAEVMHEAGLPAGVLNVVQGLGAKVGAAIVAHPDVPTISFTGGTATGRTIAGVAGPMFKALALELGGKNPYVVFADADLDAAVATAERAAFANQGQICLCGSRLLVERSVYDDFVARFVARVRERRCGDPLEEGTVHGAVISAAHREKVAGYIALARAEGGRVLCGGGPPAELPERCRDGYFLEPTVIAGLGADCRTNREEIFGPVATVMPFDDEAEALAAANGTDYGLAASIWTRDIDRAHRFAAAVESGIVWINCWLVRDLRTPFGGMKQSGVGREGGEEALHFFTEPKTICLAIRGG